jgi:hypothetical protein
VSRDGLEVRELKVYAATHLALVTCKSTRVWSFLGLILDWIVVDIPICLGSFLISVQINHDYIHIPGDSYASSGGTHRRHDLPTRGLDDALQKCGVSVAQDSRNWPRLLVLSPQRISRIGLQPQPTPPHTYQHVRLRLSTQSPHLSGPTAISTPTQALHPRNNDAMDYDPEGGAINVRFLQVHRPLCLPEDT